MYLQGHVAVLQARVSVELPTHCFPAPLGIGLLQCLTRTWVPFPQVRLQLCQSEYGDQPPSTGSAECRETNIPKGRLGSVGTGNAP